MSSTASSELAFRIGAGEARLVVRRSPNAKRMRLAVDARDGAVRLTLPRRTALAAGLRWVEEKRPWLESALARLPPPPPPLGPGSVVPVEGSACTVDWSATHPRAVQLDGDRLVVGGPPESMAARLLRFLKARALLRLTADSEAIAGQAEVAIGRVTIGDPRTRWGSCSSSGDLRYSWRLILMPPDVRRAVVAHEVAHRLHMNHGPAFHQAVAVLLGRSPDAETRWLRTHGSGLHRILPRG